MHRRTALALSIVMGAVAPTLAAQEHAHGHGERLGRVVFPVSCTREAQHRFERAMAALHSFWWEEGPHAFGAVDLKRHVPFGVKTADSLDEARFAVVRRRLLFGPLWRLWARALALLRRA